MTADEHPGRCFDSPVRFRAIREHRGTKYIYRPDRVGWLDLHRVRPRLGRSANKIVYGIGVATWPPLALRRKLYLARRLIKALSGMAARAARILSNRGPVRTGIAEIRDPGPLFFYHFKALNTEWKYRRAIVEAGS